MNILYITRLQGSEGLKAMSDQESKNKLLQMTTQIVAAHAGHNVLAVEDLPTLIKNVHGALASLADAAIPNDRPQPAVSIKKSITPDYIICLEDGKKLKMLKRHLKTAYNMTPEEYREKWGLSPDYPMVAPNYAQHRSSLAKKIDLGTRERRTAE